MKMLDTLTFEDIRNKENGISLLLKRIANRRKMTFIFHIFSYFVYLFLLISKKPNPSFLSQIKVYFFVLHLSLINFSIFYIFSRKENYFLRKENLDKTRTYQLQEEIKDCLLADKKSIIGKKHIFFLRQSGLAVVPKEEILGVDLLISSNAIVYLETKLGRTSFRIHHNNIAKLYQRKSLAVFDMKFNSEEEKDLYKEKQGLGKGEWEFLKHLILTTL